MTLAALAARSAAASSRPARRCSHTSSGSSATTRAERVHHRAGEEALAEAERWRAGRAAPRHPGRGQGRDRRRRHAHDRGVEDPRDNVAARATPTVVARLRAAGSGRARQAEHARVRVRGASTTSPHFGPARNPWAPIASAAARAAAAAPRPRPTSPPARSARTRPARSGSRRLLRRHRPAAVDRASSRTEGVVPVSWTFDTVGPIARSAEDCSLLLEAIAPAYRAGTGRGVGGLRVGVVAQLFERRRARSRRGRRGGGRRARSLGARVEPVDASRCSRRPARSSSSIMLPEAAEAHLAVAAHAARRLRRRRPRAPARRAAPAGDRLRHRPAGAALALANEVRPLFERFDLLAAPAMPVVPPRIGEETVDVAGEEMPYRLALIPFNSPWSCAGSRRERAVRLRRRAARRARARRPALGEATVLRAAHAFQQVTDWHGGDRRSPT